MRLRAEKRVDSPVWMNAAVSVFSVLFAFAAGGVFLYLQGVSPAEAYWTILQSAFGSAYDLSETVVKTLPLAMVSLAVMLCFTMLIWNIGAEGQALIGALAAAAAVRYFPVDNRIAMLTIMALAAAAAGGLWAGFAGFLKARWNVNEIITTLMLNYIAIRLLEYFVYGPWRDPSSLGFPMTKPFIDSARLPSLWGTRIHMGLYGILILTAVMWVLLKKTRWGYEIRVMGSSMKAAEYAGMDRFRTTILVMAISGGIAGLAGMTEVSGVIGKLQPGISAGYGYTAIIIAWLGKLHPAAITIVAFFFGALQVGGYWVQSAGVPATVAAMLQGAILFFVVGGEFLTRYEIQFGKGENA